MSSECQDFGTGLRAHLGLEVADAAVETSEPAPAPESPPLEPVAELAPTTPESELLALEAELRERAHRLALREQLFERRSTALLAQVQALYAELHGEIPVLEDELAARRALRPA